MSAILPYPERWLSVTDPSKLPVRSRALLERSKKTDYGWEADIRMSFVFQLVLGRERTVRFLGRNGAMETFGRRTVDVVIANEGVFRLSAPIYSYAIHSEKYEITVAYVKDSPELQITDLQHFKPLSVLVCLRC